jgi:cyclohexa-1,5-dienecarbonyl-CoA hydratase
VSAAEGILLRRRPGGRADVEIRLPPVNVLTVAALSELARKAAEAPPARVVVLAGLSRAFSAGVSVEEHEPPAIERMLAAMRAVLQALVDVPAVTVASVSGACLGGGAEIVAACDVVLVAADARIGFPETRLACFPPGAAALLPARLTEARAAEWILTGRVFSGREAAEAGFASRAVEPSALAVETDRLAERLLAAAPAGLSAARDLLRAGRRAALASALPRAEAAYRALAGDEDLRRVVRAFPGKRSR